MKLTAYLTVKYFAAELWSDYNVELLIGGLIMTLLFCHCNSANARTFDDF
jgi:hypothetical protein